MNEELKHPEVEYERSDLSALAILGFLAGLAIVGLVMHIILAGMFGYLDTYTKRRQATTNPLAPPAAVDDIARDRMAQRGQVHADLVGAPRLQPHLQQREAREPFPHAPARHRAPPLPWRAHGHARGPLAHGPAQLVGIMPFRGGFHTRFSLSNAFAASIILPGPTTGSSSP